MRCSWTATGHGRSNRPSLLKTGWPVAYQSHCGARPIYARTTAVLATLVSRHVLGRGNLLSYGASDMEVVIQS